MIVRVGYIMIGVVVLTKVQASAHMTSTQRPAC